MINEIQHRNIQLLNEEIVFLFPLEPNKHSFFCLILHRMNSFEVDDISKGSYVGNGPHILLQ